MPSPKDLAPRIDIDTKQITQNKAVCLPRGAWFGFDISGFSLAKPRAD
jgi:hypothetical protein